MSADKPVFLTAQEALAWSRETGSPAGCEVGRRPRPYSLGQKLRLWLLNPRAALFGRWIRRAVIANGGELGPGEWPRKPWYLR